MGTAWAQHGHGMLCVNRPLVSSVLDLRERERERERIILFNDAVKCCNYVMSVADD